MSNPSTNNLLLIDASLDGFGFALDPIGNVIAAHGDKIFGYSINDNYTKLVLSSFRHFFLTEKIKLAFHKRIHLL